MIKGRFDSTECHYDAALRFAVMILPDCPSGRVKAGGGVIIEIHREIFADFSIFIGYFLCPFEIFFAHALEDGTIEGGTPT